MKTELYNGEVELLFDDKKHVYTVANEIVPSVTGITGIIDKSGPLMWWGIGQCIDWIKENMANTDLTDEVAAKAFWHDAHRAHFRASKTATDIGHMAHEWIEKCLNPIEATPSMPVNKQLLATVESWLAWADEVDLQPVDTEFKVYSRDYKYAGTCDYDGLINGERCICDWKTGKAVYPEHRLQTAAYQIAREEELSVEYQARWIVVLPKDGGDIITERIDPSDYSRDAEGFLGALNLYRAIK